MVSSSSEISSESHSSSALAATFRLVAEAMCRFRREEKYFEEDSNGPWSFHR